MFNDELRDAMGKLIFPNLISVKSSMDHQLYVFCLGGTFRQTGLNNCAIIQNIEMVIFQIICHILFYYHWKESVISNLCI